MMTKTELEEITALAAAGRLHLDRSNVIKSIKRGELTARLVIDVPLPYWLIAIDEKFLAKEKTRSQS